MLNGPICQYLTLFLYFLSLTPRKCLLWTLTVSRREAHSFDILHAISRGGRRDVIKEGKSTHRTTGAVGVLLHCQLSCNCKVLILWPPLHHLLLTRLSQGWWLLMGKHAGNLHKINFPEHRWRSQHSILYTDGQTARSEGACSGFKGQAKRSS